MAGDSRTPDQIRDDERRDQDIRREATHLANGRAKPDATAASIVADANTIFNFIKNGQAAS